MFQFQKRCQKYEYFVRRFTWRTHTVWTHTATSIAFTGVHIKLAKVWPLCCVVLCCAWPLVNKQRNNTTTGKRATTNAQTDSVDVCQGGSLQSVKECGRFTECTVSGSTNKSECVISNSDHTHSGQFANPVDFSKTEPERTTTRRQFC